MDARGWPHRGREKQLTRAASRTQTFTNRGRTLGDREGKKLIFHSPTASSFFPLCYFCAFLFHCSQLIVPEREAILFFSPSILQFLLLFSSVFTRSDVKSISFMQGGQLCQKWRKEGRSNFLLSFLFVRSQKGSVSPALLLSPCSLYRPWSIFHSSRQPKVHLHPFAYSLFHFLRFPQHHSACFERLRRWTVICQYVGLKCLCTKIDNRQNPKKNK